MNKRELKDFLDEKVQLYNSPTFIESDPIQIPHQFSKKEDIEIAGFLIATIAWGNRKSIITNGNKMMHLLDQSPHDFVFNASKNDIQSLAPFVHRTFNAIDFQFFVESLQHIYKHHSGLEQVFSQGVTANSTQPAIHSFRKVFFSLPHQIRTEKHVSDPFKKSAAKRLNMYLRWMVRNDQAGVDFGIWKRIAPSVLSCPLDVHSGNVARKLGILKRKQNDAKALHELDTSLRTLDETDPVKYDFALFGLGAFERF